MAATTTGKKQQTVQKNSDTTIKFGTKTFLVTQEEKISYLLLALIIFLVVLIRSKFLLIPYERDEGGYSYYGKLLLSGKIPYKDFYEQKLPGIFYFYAMMISIFGSSVKEMHTGFIFLNIATILLLFFASKRLFTPFTGLITAVTFALVSLTPNLSGFTIQAEHGVAFFSSLGIYLYTLVRVNKKWYWYVLMGLALGSAFMVKTTGLFVMFWGGLILVIDFVFSKERVVKELLRQVFFYCLGAISVVAFLLITIYVKGSFNDLVFWVYNIPKYYVNRISYEDGVKYFGYSRDAIVMNYKFLWVHSVLALALCLIRSIDLRTKLFVFSLAILSFLTIVPGYYFYGHYWIQLIPGMAMLSGITYYCVMSLLKNGFNIASPNLKYVYIAVFSVFVLMHLNKQRSYYFSPNYDLILRQVYGNNPFPETMEIAKYLNSVAKPEDQVAVFGSEPELFIYMNKISPTRHVFFSTIVASIPEHKQFQREFVRDIEKVKPKYFVFYRHSVSLLVQANVDQYVFEWANKYLAENYKVIGVVDMPDNTLRSIYKYGVEAAAYQPTAQNVIYIFEKKS
ncbi:MAG: glycosyltransferase family 39 protein [bacterium]|nr:glycosyltransferase family 39 protein [bacterium]